MWFQFPEGVSAISVQLQDFSAQAADENGREYFHAPDHFAPLILDLPGFIAKKPPDADKIQIPMESRSSDDALVRVASQVEAFKLENGNLRSTIAELSAQRDDLKVENNNLKGEVSQLKEEIEELKKPTTKVKG
jgi:peptidoglycan hydrolase CwlO-like protein